jgi:uncharacterized phiE125 gp8 family phage protein
MRPHYYIAIQPALEAVTYKEAADQLRVDSADDTVYIEALIGVAVEYVQDVTGRVGSKATWVCTADSWASLTQGRSDKTVRIGRTPLVSVTSVQYYAPDATTLTTLSTDEYRVITATEPGILQPLEDWPEVDDRADAIQITFVAGQQDGCGAPPGWKHAVKMLVAHLYEERKPVAFASCNEIPFGLQSLIESQRMEGRFA